MSELSKLFPNGFVRLPNWLSAEQKNFMLRAMSDYEALLSENQRLTDIATKHATRADELHEALEMCIEALERSYDATEWPADGSSQQEVTSAQCREVLNRTKIDAVSNSNDD